MDNEVVFDVADLINHQKIRAIHCVVVLFSFALMLADGYDIVCIGYVAPLLQKEWGFPPSSFGSLFGSAALGAAIGPLMFGYLGGRFGRKPVVLLGAVWFGAFSLAAVCATSLSQMLALRFLAGIGMGGMVAITIALVSEFSPRNLRATMVVIGVVGTALGGGLAGLVAYSLLGSHTWHSVFLLGGIPPILLAIVGLWILPESPKYLVLRPHRRAELISLLERLGSPALRRDALPDVRRCDAVARDWLWQCVDSSLGARDCAPARTRRSRCGRRGAHPPAAPVVPVSGCPPRTPPPETGSTAPSNPSTAISNSRRNYPL